MKYEECVEYIMIEWGKDNIHRININGKKVHRYLEKKLKYY